MKPTLISVLFATLVTTTASASTEGPKPELQVASDVVQFTCTVKYEVQKFGLGPIETREKSFEAKAGPEILNPDSYLKGPAGFAGVMQTIYDLDLNESGFLRTHLQLSVSAPAKQQPARLSIWTVQYTHPQSILESVVERSSRAKFQPEDFMQLMHSMYGLYRWDIHREEALHTYQVDRVVGPQAQGERPESNGVMMLSPGIWLSCKQSIL